VSPVKESVQRHRRRGRQTKRNAFLKCKDEFRSRTEAGRVFQTHGPAMVNDWSPIAVRDLGTSSRAALAEPMPVRRWPVYCRSLDRYTGVRPFRHLWAMVATSNVIRWRTGNQWSDLNTSVMWSLHRVPGHRILHRLEKLERAGCRLCFIAYIHI